MRSSGQTPSDCEGDFDPASQPYGSPVREITLPPFFLSKYEAVQWSRAQAVPKEWPFEPWADGFCVHAPAGSFRPNPYGIHNTIGNVLEFVALEPIEGMPANVVAVVDGSYCEGADRERVSYRGFVRTATVGVRAAMSLLPAGG